MNLRELLENEWKQLKRKKLLQLYINKRKQFNINSTENYYQMYKIESWMIILSKAPMVKVYKGEQDINEIILYIRKEDVVRFIPGLHHILVYTPELFKMYREAMKLPLLTKEELIFHYFENNGYGFAEQFLIKGKTYVFEKLNKGVWVEK